MTMHRLATCSRLAPWALALAVGSLAAPSAWAQPDSQRGRGNGLRMGIVDLAASHTAIQEELKLSTDEVERVKKLAEEEQSSRRGLRDLSDDERRKKGQEMSDSFEKKASEIMSPDQFKRLKQVFLQVRGPWAFHNPQVISELKLTDEQKEKFDAITRETGEAANGLRQATDPEAARKEFVKLRAIAVEKIVAGLTPEQQSKWKEMTGEPFKGDLPMPFGGRGGRRN
jgi:Spy/CpxP family protein refolding chaperone